MLRIVSILMCGAALRLVLAVPLIAHAQITEKPVAIQSEADLVVLPVTVTDKKDHPIRDLKKEEFRIFDNGRPQTLSLFIHGDVPVTVGLLIDCSQSMRFNRSQVTEAAKDFLISSNPQDKIFVVNFNEAANFGLPPGVPFTNDVTKLEAAVQSGPSEGMTALYDAIDLGLKHLDLGGNNKKALIIISDGGDNASELKQRNIIAALERSSVETYAIGIVDEFQSDVNPNVLRKLASATGGEAYFPKSAEQLPAISQQIAHDLREQYTLAYLPVRVGKSGAFHTIRVSLPKHKNVRIRTRDGYLAISNPEANPKSDPGSQ